MQPLPQKYCGVCNEFKRLQKWKTVPLPGVAVAMCASKPLCAKLQKLGIILLDSNPRGSLFCCVGCNKKANAAVKWAKENMERSYSSLLDNAGLCRDPVVISSDNPLTSSACRDYKSLVINFQPKHIYDCFK
jgi:hypothetical protein